MRLLNRPKPLAIFVQFIMFYILPLISGFLLTGIVAGTYVLDLISMEATSNLRFVDEIALGFIAFAAGGELYLKELKTRVKSIACCRIFINGHE